MSKTPKSRLPAQDENGKACEVVTYTMTEPTSLAGGLDFVKSTPYFYELDDGTPLTPVEGERGVSVTPDGRRITLLDPDRA